MSLRNYCKPTLKKGFKDIKVTEWSSASPNCNQTENLWLLIKRDVYEKGKLYSSKEDF